ncbi:MAG: hypothetical protein JOZ72_00615 [Alphaproteobacteria bacterium]|nr:hypothetical protein [Alphaproteobacteria bacterium]
MRTIFALTVAVATLAATAADATQYKPLHAFCGLNNCSDGSKPWATPTGDGAGNYYGTTYSGGAPSDSGTVYRMHYDGTRWVYSRVHVFCTKMDCPDGAHPRAQLIVGTDGTLYGTASDGGRYGWGTIFSIAPDGSGWTYKVLHHFCAKSGCPDGARPTYAGLSYQGQQPGALYDGTSPLYGTTVNGGSQNQGTVYTLTPGATKWTQKVIHNFCSEASCADGGQVDAPVTVDAMGRVFGTTTVGGDYNHGNIFALTHGAAWHYTSLYSFCAGGGFCSDGDGAVSQLVVDGQGDLIGTTYFGGAHAKGSVFKLVPNGAHSTFSTLYSFCAQANCADGQNPQASVTLDAQGRLYGTTYGGGSGNKGTVFKLSGANLSTFTSLHSFGTTTTSGSYPTAGLALDMSGTLYGLTITGGANDLGLFYSIAP